MMLYNLALAVTLNAQTPRLVPQQEHKFCQSLYLPNRLSDLQVAEVYFFDQRLFTSP